MKILLITDTHDETRGGAEKYFFKLKCLKNMLFGYFPKEISWEFLSFYIYFPFKLNLNEG